MHDDKSDDGGDPRPDEEGLDDPAQNARLLRAMLVRLERIEASLLDAGRPRYPLSVPQLDALLAVGTFGRVVLSHPVLDLLLDGLLAVVESGRSTALLWPESVLRWTHFDGGPTKAIPWVAGVALTLRGLEALEAAAALTDAIRHDHRELYRRPCEP